MEPFLFDKHFNKLAIYFFVLLSAFLSWDKSEQRKKFFISFKSWKLCSSCSSPDSDIQVGGQKAEKDTEMDLNSNPPFYS